MPIRVPQAQRQVQEQAIPQIRLQENAPIEAFGGGAAVQGKFQAVSKLANVTQDIYEKEKKKKEDSDFYAYDTELLNASNEIELEAQKYQGENAVKAPVELGEKWKKRVDEIRQKYGESDRFKKTESIRSAALNDFVNKFSYRENEKHVDRQFEVYLDKNKNDAMGNFGDPERVNLSLDAQKAAIEGHGQLRGWSPTDIKLKQETAESNTHVGILGRILDSDSANKSSTAIKYYESNKDKLVGEDSKKAAKLIKDAALNDEARRISDGILKESQSYSGALASLKGIEDTDLKDAVKKDIEDFYSSKERAEKYDKEQRLTAAYNVLDASPDVNKVPRTLWNTLSGSERIALEKYAKERKDGGAGSTDWKTYEELRMMAANPSTSKEFLNLSLMDYKSKLGNTEFKEMVKLRDDLLKTGGKGSKLLDGIRTNNEMVDTALRTMKLDPNSKIPAEQNRILGFRRKVDQEVVSEQLKLGRELNSPEIQKIIDKLTPEVVTEKGWFWDTRKRKFELQQGEKGEATYSDIPPDEIPSITESLKKRGTPVTKENITKLYNNWLNANGK